MDDLISRQSAIYIASGYCHPANIAKELAKLPSAQPDGYVKIPETGIDDLSDGFHTFRQLYYQRMMLFATIVKQNKDKAWKSLRHEDGKLCFGGGWFIVGVDTPEGSYTYHYEDTFYSLFDCEELERARHWDGHTEKDVTRLLSLPSTQPEWGLPVDVDRPLADKEIVSRLRDIQKQIGGSYAIDRAIEVIEAVAEQSTQPEQWWIPCSELLPKEGQKILATVVDNSFVDVYIIRGYYKKMHKSVIAWMPLPGPWKGESNANNNSQN